MRSPLRDFVFLCLNLSWSECCNGHRGKHDDLFHFEFFGGLMAD